MRLARFILVTVVVTVCRAEFCDEGPPGKYCLEDLSGYHDCHIDPKTKKMVDTVHKCTVAGTRCQCFWGPPCDPSVEDPCAKYRTPPSFPSKFSLFVEIQEQHCNKSKCSDVIFRQQQTYQDESDSTKQKFRSDDNFPNYAETTIWLQKNASEFTMYSIRFDKDTCVKGSSAAIPKLRLDPRFSYSGTKTVGSKSLEEWVWKTGGHNPSQTTTSAVWYIWKNIWVEDQHYEPVMLTTVTKSPTDKTNQTLHAEMSFTPTVDEKEFDPPAICK